MKHDLSCVTCDDRTHLALESDGKWRCVDVMACIHRREVLLDGGRHSEEADRG